MIVLFTDFGSRGPYVGQMQAVLCREAPGVPVIDLFADAPTFDPKASAYLLAAYAVEFPAGSVVLCVVDPGVGGNRAPLAVKADGRWYVGPDNGLFTIAARRAKAVEAWEITWRPARLSASFHGRDLFAPVAARLALGEPPPGAPRAVPAEDWPDDLSEVIYIDGFGNAMTGFRASVLPENAVLSVSGRRLPRARTFSDVAPGGGFWYDNANGLAEIAVNRGRAADLLTLRVGSAVEVESA
jgi:S-adenosylmethionine hydrolase